MPSKSKNAKTKTKRKSTANLSGSVEAAIKVMTSAMQDPLSSHVCSIRLGEASYRIDEELASFHSTSDKSKFARSHPELLRAGIRFLTTKHEPGIGYQLFRDTMMLCDHDCTIVSRNQRSAVGLAGVRVRGDRCTALPSKFEEVWVYYDAINTVSTLIEHSLLDLTRHKFHTSHVDAGEPDEADSDHKIEDSSSSSSNNHHHTLGRVSNAAQQKWPCGPDDLLPFGIEDSAFALGLWACTPPFAAGIFKLVGALSSFYAPFSQHIMGPTEPHPLFNTYPSDFLKHIIEDYDRLSSRTLRRPVPALDFIAHHFSFSMNAVFGLYAYMQRCKMMFPHVIAFYTGPKIVPYFSKIMEILDNPAIDRCMKDTIEQTKRIVQRMCIYSASDDYCKSHLPANSVTMPPDGISMSYRERMISLIEGRGVDRTFETLQATRKAGCANVDCPLPEESAVHAMLCSKCDLIRFCSHDVRVFVFHSHFLIVNKVTFIFTCGLTKFTCIHVLAGQVNLST